MNAIVEIDRAGRLVVPKKFRDALHLSPGTRVSLEVHGETIVVTPDTPEANAHQKNGLWVYDAADTITADEVRTQIEAGREEREHRARGKVPAA